MQDTRHLDKYAIIKQIYHAHKSPISVPKFKSKSPILLYKQKEVNIFKRSNPKQKVKQHVDQSIIKSSKAYRELQLQILMETRRHWFQIDRLKQNSRLKEIKKLKEENEKKRVEVQEIDERVKQLQGCVGEEQQDYYYMTSNTPSYLDQQIEQQQQSNQQNEQQNKDQDEQSRQQQQSLQNSKQVKIFKKSKKQRSSHQTQ